VAPVGEITNPKLQITNGKKTKKDITKNVKTL
jgi:ribosomal protein S28E/S33